jgi:hypothetical protein
MLPPFSARSLVVATLAFICTMGQPVATSALNVDQLDSRIGTANVSLYRSIRDSNEWKNPFLIIRPDGIEVITSGIPSGRRVVASSELRRTLVDLPVTAWPYGRVVAVQEIKIRAADKKAERVIEAASAILKALRITIERWPS